MPKCCLMPTIAGRGIALVPTFIVAGALQAGRLTTCLDIYPTPPLALYALYPPTRHLAAKVRLFIDFLVKRFES
jgi:DNA-binding transcriptional LysR family regulator